MYVNGIYSFDAIIDYLCILHCSNDVVIQLISSFNQLLLFFYYAMTAMIFYSDTQQRDCTMHMMIVYFSSIVSFTLELTLLFAVWIDILALWCFISNKNDISVYDTCKLFKISSKECIDHQNHCTLLIM